MIEAIPDLPNHVVGFAAHGEITAEDYRNVLEPALNTDYADGRKPAVLFVVESDFSGFSGGALWEDFNFGIRHLNGWQKIALVGDVGWVTHLANLAKHIVPAKVKLFPLSERDAALEWVAAE